MATKFLQTEEDMKDVNDKVYLKKDIPYLIDNEGMVEMEDGTRVSLHFVWVNFKVIHRTR